MSKIKISKSYKIILITGIILFLAISAIILIKAVNLDLSLTGGTRLEYRVGKNNIDKYYDDIKHLVKKDNFEIVKNEYDNDDVLVLHIKNDYLERDYLEKNFTLDDYELITESVFRENIGNQIILKFVIIFIAFLILVFIASLFVYINIGGYKTGISLLLSIIYNITILLGIYSITNTLLGFNFFILSVFIVILSSVNFIIIFAKAKEIEKNAPTGLLKADILIDKSLNDTINTILFSGLSIIIVSIALFAIMILVLKYATFSLVLPYIIGVIISYLNSIFIIPSIWFAINKNKEF